MRIVDVNLRTSERSKLLARSRYYCYGLILCSSLIISACGGSGSAEEPDIDGAQEQTENNSQSPATDSVNSTDIPENPDTHSENPATDPETPAQDDPTALNGSVNSYPSSTTDENDIVNDAAQLFDDETTQTTALTRDDMQPAQALVSLFLLADVNFQTPIATVKSDIDGNYKVTASDVRDYLLNQQLIADDATDDEVLASFRSLGRLQVRALIVRERNGVRRAMAIQSLADPANVDESGVPVPVTIDPIVHSVVKAIVDSIRDSVANLESMGLSQTVVDQLINTVVEEVVTPTWQNVRHVENVDHSMTSTSST